MVSPSVEGRCDFERSMYSVKIIMLLEEIVKNWLTRFDIFNECRRGSEIYRCNKISVSRS